MTTRLLTISLLLLAVLLAGACGAPTAAPTAGPTSTPCEACAGPTAAPTPAADPAGARDAALAYLRSGGDTGAPAADLAWTEQHARPNELIGGDAYNYLSGDWLITVSYPSDLTVYTVKMANGVTGFSWEGQVDPAGNVLEGEALVLSVLQSALAHVRTKYGAEAPPADLSWQGERITPAGLVGSDTYRYTAGDWVATVTYPLVSPEDMVFNITVENRTTGFSWIGSIDANGQITEVE